MSDISGSGQRSEVSVPSVSHEHAVATDLTFSATTTVRPGTESDADTNIFLASQRGDVAVITSILAANPELATARDEQNITPLHWAAINAHIPACLVLLQNGAEIDALGGDLVATPLQWAARNGFIYVIQLLIEWGADPTIRDSQGYNSLHLVTHSSGVMPLLYLLNLPDQDDEISSGSASRKKGVSVDSVDSSGHTALMWACYQGDAISVSLLLRHNANANARDDAGLTPLHWAVVRANRTIIRKLVEAGADLSAKDGEGRTPKEMAAELKSSGAFKRALEEGGLDDTGRPMKKPLSDRNTKLAILILPTLFFYLIFMTLTVLPWYTGVFVALAEFFALHHIVTRVLLGKSTYADSASVQQTPYFAGIICASMIWVGYTWLTRLVGTPHAFGDLVFALTFGLCGYNFFRAITLDPGSPPNPSGRAELREIIESLAREGRLNGQTFCVECLARKPIRSKHCRVCDKCVARSDHHCPWVWNCVGANNHRQFVLFVSTLVLDIVVFDWLAYEYFAAMPESTLPPASPACLLPTEMCALAAADSFLVSVALWATIQLSWTVVLLASQLWQISRQMTTLEVTNLGRYGFMGGRGGASLAGQQSHGHRSPSDGGSHSHSHSHSCCGNNNFLMSLLGFDRFTKGKAAQGLQKAAKAENPFDSGMVGNCKDFWRMGKELGVEYDRLYEVPMEGFKAAKSRREQDERDLHGHGGGPAQKQRNATSILDGLRMNLSGSRRAGYEPVSQV